MNKWLYRAVGAVGVASGALLLSNGVAHAQATNDARPDLDPQAMRGRVADFFTPLGQSREESVSDLLGGGSPLSGLTNLAGLGAGDGLADNLARKGIYGGPLVGPIGGRVLSALADSLSSRLIGSGGGFLDETLDHLNNLTDSADVADPSDVDGAEPHSPIDPAQLRDLIGTALDTTAQRPIQLNPDVSWQIDNAAEEPMVEALIADTLAKRMGLATQAATQPVEEDLPIVSDLPGLTSLVSLDGPLKDLLAVGSLASGVPVVGDVLSDALDPGAVTTLPVVSQILDHGIPLVGQALGDKGDRAKGSPDGSERRMMRRPAPNASQMGSHPGMPTTLPATVPNAPNTSGYASAPMPAPASGQHNSRAAHSPVHVGRHRATDRPEVIDPELEAAGLVPVESDTAA